MQRNSRPARTVRFGPLFRQIASEEAPSAPMMEQQSKLDSHGTASEEGLSIISVAARILRMHPHTLRKYERWGLVRPSRTIGMLRLYSERDISKLRMIKHLVDEMRLNLAGVEMAMTVFDRLNSAMDQASLSKSRPSNTFEEAFEDILNLFLGQAARRRRSTGGFQ